MKKFSAAVLAGVLATGIVLPPGWAQDSTARTDIQALLDAAAGGFNHRGGMDLDEITAIAIPEATLRYADGTTMTIEKWKEKADKDCGKIASMQANYKLLEAEVEVPRASITYVTTINFRLKADMEYKYQTVSRWSAMLIKTPTGWRVKQYMQLSEETTRDGKSLPPGVSPPRW
ncbi:MAG: hypothetical protein WCP22_00350 [Chlamydiota bacterium]